MHHANERGRRIGDPCAHCRPPQIKTETAGAVSFSVGSGKEIPFAPQKEIDLIRERIKRLNEELG